MGGRPRFREGKSSVKVKGKLGGVYLREYYAAFSKGRVKSDIRIMLENWETLFLTIPK